MSSNIDQMMQKRREQEQAAAAAAAPQPVVVEESAGEKFFSILVGEGTEEKYLELQSKDGLHTCFSYSNLGWFAYDPEDGILLEFNGYSVHVQGRGLYPKLLNGLKQKRVAWIKEADSEMEDHKGNETYVSSISITPPESWATENSSAA